MAACFTVSTVLASQAQVGTTAEAVSRFSGVMVPGARVETSGRVESRASTTDTGRIRFSANFVCTVESLAYLRIEPAVLWVFPDYSVDNAVFSNTRWNVE